MWSCSLKYLMIAVLLIFSTQTRAQDNQGVSGKELIGLLQKGGYNLYIRHVATDWTQTDKINKKGDWKSCDPKLIRQLSGKGRDDSRTIGKAIRFFKIPIQQIYASPYCRTIETVSLMELGKVEVTHDLMNLRSANFVGGVDQVIQRAQAKLSKAPNAGTNTLLSSHGNLANAATNVYPAEGEIIAFRPIEQGFRFVGRITPEQWEKLLKAQGQ